MRREKVPRPQRKDYGKEVDIWAVGVLAYELFTRQAPFDGCGPPCFPSWAARAEVRAPR